MNWQNLTTVKKGNIGEELVNKFLIEKGYIPYAPVANGAHPFDRLVASRDKRKIFIADSKAKAKRKYYPDTGIDVRHYNEYKHLQDKYNMDVFIFFVDEEAAKIYGNLLTKLSTPTTITHNEKALQYPLTQGGIIYFPVSNCIHVADIPKGVAEDMKQATTKNPRYK